MAIGEHDRFELHRALEQAIGTEQAATLMEHLPPVGWADVATKRDLDHLATVLRAEMAVLGSGLRSEMRTMRSDMDTMRFELRAEMHQTISTAIATQTRTLVFALIGSQFTMAALAFGAAKLGR